MKKISKNIILLTLVASAFFVGFFIGNKNKVLADSVTYSIENKSISPEDFKLYWKALSILDTKHPDSNTISSKEKVWASIAGLTQSYGDPYTTFFNPKETEIFEENINGEFSGVGMEIGIQDGYITVIAPLKNSPAESAGIVSGDIIVAVNGESVLDMTLNAVVDKIRGKRGTSLILNLKRGDEIIDLGIIRDTIEITSIETKDLDSVFVISLYSFTEDIGVQFSKAMGEFIISGKNKLILDLRSNPGGYLTSSIDVASWFVPQGKTIVSESFSSESGEQDVVYKSKGTSKKLPKNLSMIVLVDGGSASASEIVAGALQEYKVAKLLGTKTFGKGSVQEYIKLDKDTALKVTVARWLTPLGNSISHDGLIPDIEVLYDKEVGDDNQLQAAVELLNKK